MPIVLFYEIRIHMKYIYLKLFLFILLFTLSGSILGQTATVVNPSTSTSSDGSITVDWASIFLTHYVSLDGADVVKVSSSTNQVVFSDLGVGEYKLSYYVSLFGLRLWGSKTVTLTAECLLELSCVGDQSKSADVGACYYTVDGTEFDPTVSEITCGFASLVNDFNAGETLAGAQIPSGTVITWTVTDNSSNTATCKFTVTVNDNEDPVTPTLADVTGECSATAVAPTTTDACVGTITGTTTDALTYTTQGTHVITWNFADGNGNDIDVTQNVIIADVTKPTLDVLSDMSTVVCADDDATQSAKVYNLNLTEDKYDDNCTSKENMIIQYKINAPGTEFDVSFKNTAIGATSSSDPSGFAFPEGISTVIYRVKDEAGKSRNRRFTVTVNPKPKPIGIFFE